MFFAERLSPFVKNLILLKGGMGQKQRRQMADKIDAIPKNEERLIIATGRYLISSPACFMARCPRPICGATAPFLSYERGSPYL
jgi:hypothetical protein